MDSGGNVVTFEKIWIAACLFALAGTVAYYSTSYRSIKDANAVLIEECERSLPRDLNCKLVAVPDVVPMSSGELEEAW